MSKIVSGLVVGFLVSVAATLGDTPLSPSVFDFSEKELKEAARYVEDETLHGDRQTVYAPAAALVLFPRLSVKFRRTVSEMERNTEIRLRPRNQQDLTHSYEADIRLRQDFNAILLGIQQEAARLKERFGAFDEELQEELEIFENQAEAFREAGEIVDKEISVVAQSSRLRDLVVDWPENLPYEAYDQLNDLFESLLDADGEARTRAWYRLRRGFRRLRDAHTASHRQLRQEASLRQRLLRFDPANVFNEIYFQIEDAIKANEEGIDRGYRGMDIVTGRTRVDTPTAEGIDSETESEEGHQGADMSTRTKKID